MGFKIQFSVTRRPCPIFGYLYQFFSIAFSFGRIIQIEFLKFGAIIYSIE